MLTTFDSKMKYLFNCKNDFIPDLRILKFIQFSVCLVPLIKNRDSVFYN